jgi:hypothetical protein
LIKRLKKIGFEEPYPGSDHGYMVRGNNFVRLPNPQQREIGATSSQKYFVRVEFLVMSG